MNLRSLKVFVFVMEEGTLARAADRMNLSQSAASRLLHLLEDEFAVELFRRDRKRLIPTVAAERFYPEALRIMSQVEALPDFVKQIQSDTPEPLRVIAQTRIVNGLVLPAIAHFAKQMPDQPVKLEIHLRRDLGRRMMNDRYDVGVSALPMPVVQPAPHILGAASLKVAIAKDHPLATLSKLGPKDVTGIPYIALDETTVIRRIVDREMAAYGVKLKAAHEVSLGTAAYRMVHSGLGFTFADAVALDPELSDDIALIDWHPHMAIEFGYFLPNAEKPGKIEDKTMAAHAFGDALRHVFDHRGTGRHTNTDPGDKKH